MGWHQLRDKKHRKENRLAKQHVAPMVAALAAALAMAALASAA